jgi:hypothetical protein
MAENGVTLTDDVYSELTDNTKTTARDNGFTAHDDLNKPNGDDGFTGSLVIWLD